MFSSLLVTDSKSLLSLGGAPDWCMILWHWEKGRAISSVRVSNAQGMRIICSIPIKHIDFVVFLKLTQGINTTVTQYLQ